MELPCIEGSEILQSDEALQNKYDSYILDNTTGIKWLKWKVYLSLGIRPDKNIKEAIFKVNYDTLKKQLQNNKYT